MLSKFSRILDLPIWFLITLCAFQSLFIALVFQNYKSLAQSMTYVHNEIAGVNASVNELEKIIFLGQYRGACTGVLLNLDGDFSSVCESSRSRLVSLGWNESLLDIDGLKLGVSDPVSFFNQRTQVNLQQLERISNIFSSSGLRFDKTSAIHELGISYFITMPRIIDGIGQARGMVGLTVFYPDQRLEQDKVFGVLEYQLREQEIVLNSVREFIRTSASVLFSDASTLMSGLDNYYTYVTSGSVNLNSSTDISGFINDAFNKGTEVIEGIDRYNQSLKDELLNKLRIESADVQRAIAILILLGVCLQGLVAFIIFRVAIVYLSVKSVRDASVNISNELTETLTKQDRMFAIIGHELRTPASSINMMLKDIKASERPSVSVDDVIDVSEHLISVLDDLRLSSGASLIIKDDDIDFSIAASLDSAVQSLQPFAEVNSFTVELESELSENERYIGSKSVIRQVITNLVKNAIIHSGGDHVRVEARSDQLSMAGRHFVISVSDNGRGIHLRDRERVFDAFERGDTVSDGTGLGLHIAKDLIGLLDSGRIYYSDSASGGACFRVEFKLAVVLNSCDNEPDKASQSILKGLRVLFVEDTKMLRMLGVKMLEGQGALVTEAENGRIALEHFESHKFDTVLTDIFMPDINGFELTQALRDRGFPGKIIGITAATIGGEARALIAAGADVVLPKPFTLQALEAALKAKS